MVKKTENEDLEQTVEEQIEPSEPSNGVLSEAQRAQLRKRAKDQVEKEITKIASDKFLAEEVERLRLEHGVGKPTDLAPHLNELVDFTLELPDSSDGVIQLNIPHGKKYRRGWRYTEPRHVFNDLMWIAYQNSLHEQARKGESVYGNRQPVAQYSKTVSAKTGVAA